MQTIVYSPESVLRKPITFVLGMFSDLRASWQLGRQLAKRDIRAQYRQSLLGVLWAFIIPVFTTAIFVLLQRNNVISIGAPETIAYPLFAFCGIVLWQLFAESLLAPMRIVRDARSMLAKINFPHEALLLSSIHQILFNFMIKLLLLACLVLYYGVQISWTAVMFPVAALNVAILGLAIGILLVPLGMLYNDVGNAVTPLVQVWMFITPVVYDVPKAGMLSTLMSLNPVSGVLQFARDVLFLASLEHATGALISFASCLVVLFIGWLVYKVSLPFIIERVGS